MSVYFYDKALVDRIRTVIQDDAVHIITNEKMFTKSHDKDDDPVMPAVSIYREGYSFSNTSSGMPVYRQGRTLYDEELDKLFSVRTIPIIINYQIDVWTRTREQNDEYVKDLIWFFKLYPEHKMTLTHKTATNNLLSRDVNFNVFLGNDIVDNSDINDFENKGQYYRSTFNLTIDEAQLFMIKDIPYSSFIIHLISYDMKGVEIDNATISRNPET